MPGYVLNALEDTYGVAPTTGWESYGVNSDSFKSKQDVIKRDALKPRTGAPTTARRIIDKGGEGTIELDAGDGGLGLYLTCAASTATSDVVDGGTLAYEEIFEWTADGVPEGNSICSEVYRDRRDGTLDVWDYLGGKVDQVDIGQNLDGFLTLAFKMDYLRTVRLGSDPDRDFVDTEPEFLYAWPDALITLTPKELVDGEWVDGTPETECIASFAATLPGALNLEDWCIKRGTTRHEPTRKGIPEPSGTIEWNYDNPRYFDAFKAGDFFSVTAEWEAPEAIEGSTYPSLTLELGTICFQEANDPEASNTENTKQSLPFVVLDDESGDPVARIRIVTADATLTGS